MNIKGKKLKVQPGINAGAKESKTFIVGGDIVTVVRSRITAITVQRVSDGVIDTAPSSCFKYMNNKPVKL